ncbi:MAG: hypothetical protein ABI591_03445 [Kofleriaceae bacterium]
MNAPWIREALSGVFVLRGFGDRTTAVMNVANESYRGGSFGGIDFMPPNSAGDAWILVGNWMNCFDIQPVITAYRDALANAVELANAGVTFDAGGATLDTSGSSRGELRPWHAYDGGLAINWWEKPGLREQWEATFPTLPNYLGMHMGAPHWLGRGITGDSNRLVSVTPYIRLDFREGAGVRVAALTEPHDFEVWLDALRAVTGWP